MNYDVRASKTSHASFTITASSKKEAEEVIAGKLRTDKGIVWTDDPEGISVACISGNAIWRIPKRFSLNDE